MDFVLIGLSAYYILRALCLQERLSHEGPFLRKDHFVVFNSGHVQRFALFDYLRAFLGAYTKTVSNNQVMWLVKDNTIGLVWQCPFCLSFWVAFLFSIPYTIHINDILMFPVIHLGIAAISRVIFRYVEDE